MLVCPLRLAILLVHSWALIIPLFASGPFSSDLAISSLLTQKSHDCQRSLSQNSVDNGPGDFFSEINSQMKNFTDDDFPRFQTLFLYVTLDNLTWHTLDAQEAIYLHSQCPLLSATTKLKAVKAAAVANLRDLSLLVSLSSYFHRFLGEVAEFLAKFLLLENPVAAIVMEEPEDLSEKNTSDRVVDPLTTIWNSNSMCNQLLHSIFCTYNLASGSGFCILMEEVNKFHLFEIPTSAKRNKYYGMIPEDVLLQVLLRANNPLEKVSKNVLSDKDLLANDSHSYFKRLEEQGDDILDEMGRKLIVNSQGPSIIAKKADVAVKAQRHKPAKLRLTVDEVYDSKDEMPHRLSVDDNDHYLLHVFR